MLRNLHISLRKKLALGVCLLAQRRISDHKFLFAVALLSVACACVRLSYGLNEGTKFDVALWAIIEATTALCVASAPALRPLIFRGAYFTGTNKYHSAGSRRMPWSVRGTKGSFVPLEENVSANLKLNEQNVGVRTTSAYETSEYATNKSSADSFSEPEKGIGDGVGNFDAKVRRFSIPLMPQASIKGMGVHVREETGRLVKEMI